MLSLIFPEQNSIFKNGFAINIANNLSVYSLLHLLQLLAEAFYSLLFIEDLYEEVARFLSEEKRICTSIGFYYGPLVWRLLSVEEKRIAWSPISIGPTWIKV